MPKLIDDWYKPSKTALTRFLWPLSCLFSGIVFLRRLAYQKGWLTSHSFPVPVIVVGNITVGGTGKTPLVIFLAAMLKAKGYTPSIITRGYKGKAKGIIDVSANTSPNNVGDEAVLLARRTDCPVVACKNRVLAVKHLLSNTKCDIVISDDGLQHYALERAIEIAVIDGIRRLGNEELLPAGPLREPVDRLSTVDFLVTNGEALTGEYAMHLELGDLHAVCNPQNKKPPSALTGKTVHAIAGIGHPERFFQTLILQGFNIIKHPFPDHHAFKPSDIDFDGPIIMTEKDAVKCLHFADERHWYLPVTATLPADFVHAMLRLLQIQESRCPVIST